MDSIIDMYLREMRKYPLLTAEEEVSLAREIEDRGNKILMHVIAKDPSVAENYLDKNIEGRKEIFFTLMDSGAADEDLEKEFNDYMERLRGTENLTVGVYRKVKDEFLNRLNERKENLDLTPEEKADIQRDEEEINYLVDTWNEPRSRMISSNLRLVVSFAKKAARKGRANLMDYIQEGNTGLYLAVDGFDYRRGYKFTTYASWWIRQSLQRATRNNSREIRIPVHIYEKLSTYSKAKDNLRQRFSQEYFTDEEVAREIVSIKNNGKKISKSDYKDAINEVKFVNSIRQTTIAGSINDVIADDECDRKFEEFISDRNASSPEENIITNQRKEKIEGIVSSLKVREAEIIRMRYGLGGKRRHTLSEIGKHYNLTRERIRQIETATIRKLSARFYMELKDLL